MIKHHRYHSLQCSTSIVLAMVIVLQYYNTWKTTTVVLIQTVTMVTSFIHTGWDCSLGYRCITDAERRNSFTVSDHQPPLCNAFRPHKTHVQIHTHTQWCQCVELIWLMKSFKVRWSHSADNGLWHMGFFHSHSNKHTHTLAHTHILYTLCCNCEDPDPTACCEDVHKHTHNPT